MLGRSGALLLGDEPGDAGLEGGRLAAVGGVARDESPGVGGLDPNVVTDSLRLNEVEK